MSVRTIYKTLDGKVKMIKRPIEKNALPFIERKIQYFMPLETIEVGDVKRLISGTNVKVGEALSPDEVTALVSEVGKYLISEIEKMEKHYVSREEKNKR